MFPTPWESWKVSHGQVVSCQGGIRCCFELTLPLWFSPWRPACVGTWKEIQVPQLHPDLLTQPFWEGIQQFCCNKPSKRVGCRMFKMRPRSRCSPLSRRNKVPSFLPQGHQLEHTPPQGHSGFRGSGYAVLC